MNLGSIEGEKQLPRRNARVVLGIYICSCSTGNEDVKLKKYKNTISRKSE